MIIDAHLHLWNKVDGNIGEPVHALGNGIISVGESTIVGMPPLLLDGRCPYEAAVAVMDAAGVSAAVVTQEYLDGNQNDYLAEVKKLCPDRFFVHGLLEFRQPDSLEEELSSVTERYGFKGIKLPAGYLSQADPRIYLTDKRLMCVFEKMERRGMILSVDLDYGETQVDEMREVARAFPHLIITLGHFAMAGRKGWHKQLSLGEEQNVYIESGGITWLFRHEGPPFPGAQEAFRTAVEQVGAEKLMWGSDFPRTLVDFTYEQTLDFLINGCDYLQDDQLSAILGGTAVKLFDFSVPAKEMKRIKKITELD